MSVSSGIANAHIFHSLLAELTANTDSDEAFITDGLSAYEDIFTDVDATSQRDILFDQLFATANLVVSDVSKVRVASRYLLTHLAIQAGTTPQTPVVEGHGAHEPACLYAELYLSSSLRNLITQEERPSDNNLPPAVLYDVYGQPCAYQKEFGEPTVFVWRQARMPTGEGERVVPAGSFVMPHYGSTRTDVRSEYFVDDVPILSLKNRPPDRIGLLRFSTFSINRALAYEAHSSYLQGYRATEGVRRLADQIHGVSRMTPAHIGQQVCDVLTQYEGGRLIAA